MIAPANVALVLLAAGRSTRFGTPDKLAAPLAGMPLALHAARTLAAIPFAAHVAVTGEGEGPDFAAHGFETVRNVDPAAGQSRSIALGVARARRSGPQAILIALGDMPLVTRDHVLALLAAFAGPSAIVASAAPHPSPPALFGAAWFDALEALEGDAGARALIRQAVLVPAAPGILADVDTPADLAALGLG